LAAIASEMAKDVVMQKRMLGFGSVAVANSRDAFDRMLREESAQWASLVKEIGLK
jgi:tripartite-type tricarboxylate transporter receptor subunit TctC